MVSRNEAQLSGFSDAFLAMTPDERRRHLEQSTVTAANWDDLEPEKRQRLESALKRKQPAADYAPPVIVDRRSHKKAV